MSQMIALAAPRDETVDLARLERDRRALVRDRQRIETRLGETRALRVDGMTAEVREERRRLKLELDAIASQARGITSKIKAERRRRARLMTLPSETAPSSVEQLVAALYRFAMSVDESTWTDEERRTMRIARDYLTSGKLS